MSFKFQRIIVLGTFLIFFAGIKPALATSEFAAKTGKSCAFCHVNPQGGGPLTAQGESFKTAGFQLPREGGSTPSPLVSFLRLIIGYIHVLAAVIWFGAIFYIHIFIKPSKLSGGLPRGERVLGWTCIGVVSVTGVVLTLLRVRSINEFWTTTFGVVWVIKVSSFLVMALIAALVTTRLNRKMREAAASGPIGTESAPIPDGKEGRPAHVIFQDQVYDVSQSALWKNGVHMGRHYAGTDLSEAVKDAPHGPEVLERMKKLGPAPAPGAKPRAAGPARLFVVFAYLNLILIFVVLLCVAWWKWGPVIIAPEPKAETVAALSKTTQGCIECHRKENVQPAQISEWELSRHAKLGIGCAECHQAQASDPDGYDHFGSRISTIVSPKDCARCHEKEVDEFESSRHAHGGEILASLDNFLGEVVEGVPAAVNGCQWCHGSKVKVLPNGRLAPESWPNTGIGRINPDGSLGSCSACHPRHRFTSAVARRPENCGRCHLGPDHPQYEIYQESKHGVAFAEASGRMNLDAREWVLGKTYSAAPTCVTCHSGANASLPFTHDVGTRISWTLRPAVSIRQDNWRQRRDKMTLTCRHCHSPGWTVNFFQQFDNAVDLYNEKFAAPAGEVMKKLADAGKITPTPFDDEIEWTYYLLWHHEGRRARHGASMMGPDYTQWHGFFEVAENFYTKFIPQAEKLLPGVTDFIAAMPPHEWLQGVPPQVRAKIESYYNQRYGGKK